ncbi:protein trichome birefringence-like 34 [Sesamum alatum]|uniref:Protein trichome birefringence-like 34 n=1 Tax=Sesamum alatum TaxID=300844 RepID=A0AAE2CE73_9LAMI|nr:protein trichome birefringence-like 34 [Sesamum alatum]
MKNLGTWKIGLNFHYVAGFFLIALVSAALFLTAENGGTLQAQDSQKRQQTARNEERKEEIRLYNEGTDSVGRCNLFSGRWVYDNLSYPLYKEANCSFMLDDYACERYGRKDLKYQNWRWQPHHCDLPRFNGTALLEKIRGKKLVFVGDSLNRNQWASMLCLIESSIHQSSPKLVNRDGNMFIFQATDYNATIGFYWSPFLVESNSDDPYRHHVKDRMIRITAIEKHARHWTDADILIFDSFMWWLEPTMTVLWGSFDSPDAIYKRVEMRLRVFEMALNTWSEWLEININRTKTKLFFRSISPYHYYGENWETPQNCYNETEPIMKETYWGIGTDRDMMRITKSTIQRLETRGLRVEYLNVTNLSDYRKDGHPSIYRKFHQHLSPEQLADPKSYSDCVHWCLPGVPDTWNHILYSYIINSS